MLEEASVLMEYLPASLGVFVVVCAAGMMGLFRSIALSKSSYEGTVESLQRQNEVLELELKRAYVTQEELRATKSCSRLCCLTEHTNNGKPTEGDSSKLEEALRAEIEELVKELVKK